MSNDDDPTRKLLESMAALSDPGGIMSMHRQLAAMSNPGGVLSMYRQLAAVSDPSVVASLSLHKAFSSALGSAQALDLASLAGNISQISTMVSLHERSAKGATFEAGMLLEDATRANLPKGLLESIRAFASMNDAALSLIHADARSTYTQLLAASAIPVLSGLGALDVDLPTCVLSLLHEQECFGSLAWLVATDEDEDEPRVVAAPWVAKARTPEPAPTEQLTIHIRCEPKCMFCGGAMLAREQQVVSTAPYDLVVSLAVAPVCATCMERSRKNPRYLLDQINGLARPQLRLVDGDDTGDGVPRGVVRLVTRDDEDDDE